MKSIVLRVLSVRRSRRRPSRKSFASACPRAGVEANGPSGPPSISGNGRYVVFASTATNLVAGDTNGVADIFLRDRDTDADGIFDEAGAVATTRLSLGPSAAQADAASIDPGDLARTAATWRSSRRPPTWSPAPNGSPQVYRVDRTTGTIVRVSESAAGDAGDAASGAPAISADGDVVAFQSQADNLVTDRRQCTSSASSCGRSRPI